MSSALSLLTVFKWRCLPQSCTMTKLEFISPTSDTSSRSVAFSSTRPNFLSQRYSISQPNYRLSPMKSALCFSPPVADIMLDLQLKRKAKLIIKTTLRLLLVACLEELNRSALIRQKEPSPCVLTVKRRTRQTEGARSARREKKSEWLKKCASC